MAELISLDEADNNKNSGSSIKIAFTPQPKKEESFENIFSQTTTKEKDSKMVTSVLSPKDELNKMQPILGSAPILQQNVEEEKISRLKKKMQRRQMIFLLFFVASLGSALYFYSQLSPNFDLLGANVTQRLTDVNTNLRKLQTDVNKYRYLSIQIDLNDFSYQSDRFFAQLQNFNNSTDSNKKAEYLKNIEEAKIAMPLLLSRIRENLSKSLVISTFPTESEAPTTDDQLLQASEEDLRTTLKENRDKLNTSATLDDPQTVKVNQKFFDNTIKLVGNRSLANILQRFSADDFKKDLDTYQAQPDATKEKTLRDFMDKILSSTQSDLATIAAVKQKRIEWSTIIQQIETETIKVDANYGQPLLYENLGGIIYTGYEFDASMNKIVLSGSTKTANGTNFTLMSNLIDQLEQSANFQDVDMRSFSKSKMDNSDNGGKGYLSNFKIDLRLETTFSSKNQPLSLESTAAPIASGVKR